MGVECFDVPTIFFVYLYSGTFQGAAVSTVSYRLSAAANEEIITIRVNFASYIQNITLKIIDKFRRDKRSVLFARLGTGWSDMRIVQVYGING